MTVFVFDKASSSMRGELTRWMLEVKAGVFVGAPNRRVADMLWERCRSKGACTGGVRIDSCRGEQGYVMEMFGSPLRSIVDCDGVQLIRCNAVESVTRHGDTAHTTSESQ